MFLIITIITIMDHWSKIIYKNLPSFLHVDFSDLDLLHLIRFHDQAIETEVKSMHLPFSDIKNHIRYTKFHIRVSFSIQDGSTPILDTAADVPLPFIIRKQSHGPGFKSNNIQSYRALSFIALAIAHWNQLNILKPIFATEDMVKILAQASRAAAYGFHILQSPECFLDTTSFTQNIPYFASQSGIQFFHLFYDILLYSRKRHPTTTTCSKDDLIVCLSYANTIAENSNSNSNSNSSLSKWFNDIHSYIITDLVYLYAIYLYQFKDLPFSKWEQDVFFKPHDICRKHSVMFSFALKGFLHIQSKIKQRLYKNCPNLLELIHELSIKLRDDYASDIPPALDTLSIIHKISHGDEWHFNPSYVSFFSKIGMDDHDKSHQKFFHDNTSTDFIPLFKSF